MEKNQKLLLIIAAVVVVIVTGLLLGGKLNREKIETADILEENIIPTVDASVEVELKSVARGQVGLTIKNAPEGTRSIEYVLSYNAASPQSDEGIITQGAIGECRRAGKTRNWECRATDQENIILGTCSSGTCVYHEVVGKINLELLFRGTYGQRLFEKEYDLE